MGWDLSIRGFISPALHAFEICHVIKSFWSLLHAIVLKLFLEILSLFVVSPNSIINGY